MFEKVDKLLSLLPFVTLTVGPGHDHHVRVQRIIEAIIIAAVAGLVSSIIATDRATAVIEVKLHQLEEQVRDINSDIHRLFDDLYAPKMSIDNPSSGFRRSR